MVGTVDEIAPAAAVRAIRLAAPRAEVYELALRAGHFGLVVGSTSNDVTWPTVAAWARWRSGEGEAPSGITAVQDDNALELSPEVRNRVGYGLELAGAVGAGMARSVLGTAQAHCSDGAGTDSRGGRTATATRPARADPTEHADLCRDAGAGAAAPFTG